MSLRSIAAIVAALLFAGAALPTLADVTGVVRGTVTVNGTARAGVSVSVKGEGTSVTTITDAQGGFTFPLVPFGRYTVTAHVDGQTDSQATIDVSTDSVSDVRLAIGGTQVIGRRRSQRHGASPETRSRSRHLGSAEIRRAACKIRVLTG